MTDRYWDSDKSRWITPQDIAAEKLAKFIAEILDEQGVFVSMVGGPDFGDLEDIIIDGTADLVELAAAIIRELDK